MIEQQIDLPLVEPPSPAMTAEGASDVATGSFYNIDQVGTGTVTVYRQADGNYAFRLVNFFVTPTYDLQLLLSSVAAPHSSAEVEGAQSQSAVTMDVTAGSLNYSAAPGVDASKYPSVVIWCPFTNSAYAAATLAPVK